jgi:subtilisin family serine protease
MATTQVREQLRATGIAQVIVVLKPAAIPPAGVGLEMAPAGAPVAPEGMLAAVAADLGTHFTSAPQSQDQALARALARKGLRRLRGGGRRLAPGSAAAEAAAVPGVRLFKHLGVLLGTVDREGLKALEADDRVQAVTGAPAISLIRPVASAPAKLSGAVTWGLERLGIPELWDRGLTGKGILVGHLDTGVDARHPALKRALADFAEFDLLGRPVGRPRRRDTDTHGTHTAGTIAGRQVGATAFGVAPGAKLASAIVIEGGNAIARILGGMDWAVGLGVRVLSMSLGLRGYREDFLPVTRVLRARNILPVFAAGNEGPGTSRSPGNYAEALSVGACDEDGLVADFSSSQRLRRRNDPVVPDLVAPGVAVISSAPGGGYESKSGSSMATPHVAGLAALLFEAKLTATADEVEAAILGSCELPEGMSPERGNRGIPNGPRARAILLRGGGNGS